MISTTLVSSGTRYQSWYGISALPERMMHLGRPEVQMHQARPEDPKAMMDSGRVGVIYLSSPTESAAGPPKTGELGGRDFAPGAVLEDGGDHQP